MPSLLTITSVMKYRKVDSSWKKSVTRFKFVNLQKVSLSLAQSTLIQYSEGYGKCKAVRIWTSIFDTLREGPDMMTTISGVD